MKRNRFISNFNFDNRNLIFDYMRSICVIWIVAFWHINAYMKNDVINSFGETNFACEITYCVLASFTFISGYFSFRLFKNIKDVLRYYLKKILRLYPLFLISTLWLTSIKFIDRQMVFRVLTIIGGLFDPRPGTVWYVCVIMTFYLFVPLINRKKIFFACIYSVIIEIGFVIAYKKAIIGQSGCCIYWLFFVFGNMVRRTKIEDRVNDIIHSLFLKINKKNDARKKLGMIDIILVIFCLFSIPLFCYFAITSTGNLFEFKTNIASFFGIIGLYLIALLLSKGPRIINKIIVIISYSSMCAYLFHREIYEYVCLKIGGRFNILAAYILVVPTIFILGFIIQYIYDYIIKILYRLTNSDNKQ